MYEKILDRSEKNRYIKYYKFLQSYDIIEIIKKIIGNGFIIEKVYLEEDCDIGMKTFEGNYSSDQFMMKYDKLDKDSISAVVLYLNDKTKIYMNDCEYVSLISIYNIELSEFIDIKKKSISIN